MTAVQWPVLILLALLADPVVRVLLGAQWDAAAPLLRLMAVASTVLAPAFMTFPVLVTMGRLRDLLWSSLIALPLSMALVIGVSFFGVTAAAASLLITSPFQMAVALYFVRRAIGLQWVDLGRAAWRSLLITLATAVLPAVVILLSPRGFDLSLTEAAVAVALSAVGWLVGLFLVDHPIRGEIRLLGRLLTSMLSLRRRSATATR